VTASASIPTLRRIVRSARLIAVVLLSPIAISACALNTQAQDLAFERWKACDKFPGITLKEIRTNGEIWVMQSSADALQRWRECDREVAQTQRARSTAQTPLVSTNPQTTDPKLAGELKVAYFTKTIPVPVKNSIRPIVTDFGRPGGTLAARVGA